MTRTDVTNYLKCRELHRLTSIEKKQQFEPKLLTRAILENGLPQNGLPAMLKQLDESFRFGRVVTDGDETPYELSLRERKIIIAISEARKVYPAKHGEPADSASNPFTASGFFWDGTWIEHRCFSFNHPSEIQHALNDPLLDLAASCFQVLPPAQRFVGIAPVILGSVRSGSYMSVLVKPYLTTTGQLTEQTIRGKENRRYLTESHIPEWVKEIPAEYFAAEVFPTVALRPYDDQRAMEAQMLVTEIANIKNPAPPPVPTIAEPFRFSEYLGPESFRNWTECLKYGTCPMYEHCWGKRP